MKNYFKKIIFGFGFTTLGLAVGLSGFAMANGELTLEQQLSELTLTLKQVFLENPPQQEQGQEDILSPLQEGQNDVLPFVSCRNFYDQNEPMSPNYVSPDWDINVLGINQNLFTDLNGDGLQDYFSAGNSPTNVVACVYLNNGRGFDPAYRCYGRYADWLNNNNSYEWRWQGDCAGN